ncbi:MAG TPA: TPM domain-containing protein [Pyrinomonadaceae bacterium]|nr:TPM domain-containing protein [Pyrinomonadaceae bacterium]
MRFRKSGSCLRLGFGLLALLFVFAAPVAAQTRPQAPVPLPTPFTPVVDYANVIDADTRQRLESIYLNLKDRSGIVFSVLTVPTTGEQPIFDYSLAVARGWGIGPPDAATPSFLLVVAIQDRKYQTQVSDHLEGDLPDGVVGQIQRERLVPAFRQGNYSKGIFDTVQANVATIASKRGFSVEGIDQNYAYRGGDEQPGFQIRQSRGSLTSVCCGIVIVVFIVIIISGASRGGRGGGRGGRGRRGGGFGGGGLLEALLWGSVLGNLTSGGRGWGSSSGWGSSGGFGGGGFGGGGSGGFGGGFGGGDSFGGGGAGGSW